MVIHKSSLYFCRCVSEHALISVGERSITRVLHLLSIDSYSLI